MICIMQASKKYRILVVGMSSNLGGVETFLYSYYSHFDKNKIKLDFLSFIPKKIAFEDEFLKDGSKVYHLTSRGQNRRLFKKELNTFFQSNASEYDCIWVNLNLLNNIDYLKLAKKYGIKRRIVHSHNSKNVIGGFKGFVLGKMHTWNRTRVKKYATDFWACSSKAANFFYDKSTIDRVKIIKNAIDINRIKFDPFKRTAIRKKYNLENWLVIGMVGNLIAQKNQIFAVSLLPKVLNKKKNVKLVLVGTGPDKKKLEDKAKELKVSKNILFVGRQTDMSGWFSAFDEYLLPSLFEGLPVVGIEAQGNGLPLIAARGIMIDNSKINDNVSELRLNAPSSLWVDEIIRKKYADRKDMNVIVKNFKSTGYDIREAAVKLQNEFLS